MSKKPLVSIITCSYNQGKFIGDCLVSVQNQAYPNIEHIVVDGNSTDNTLQILEKYEGTYNMRWISEPDEGQADAINKGFKMAKGEIIGWLNSDDTYLTRNVVTQVVNEFLKWPKVELIHGNRVIIDETNHLIGLNYSMKFNYDKFLKSIGFIYTQTSFFRHKIINKYQLDSHLHIAMDNEFWLKIGQNCRSLYLNTFLGGFRLHANSKTVSEDSTAKRNMEKKYLFDKYKNYRPIMEKRVSPLNKILCRIRLLLAGSYTNYYRIFGDLIKIASYPSEKFAFPIKINKIELLRHPLSLARPSRKIKNTHQS